MQRKGKEYKGEEEEGEEREEEEEEQEDKEEEENEENEEKDREDPGLNEGYTMHLVGPTIEKPDVASLKYTQNEQQGHIQMQNEDQMNKYHHV